MCASMNANCVAFTFAVSTSNPRLVAPVGIGMLSLLSGWATRLLEPTWPKLPAGAGALSSKVPADWLPPTTRFGLSAIGNGPLVAHVSRQFRPCGWRVRQAIVHSCLKVQLNGFPRSDLQSKRTPASPAQLRPLRSRSGLKAGAVGRAWAVTLSVALRVTALCVAEMTALNARPL